MIDNVEEGVNNSSASSKISFNKSSDKSKHGNFALLVIIAIIVAILMGHYFPATAVKMEFLGKAFISLIKLFIAPIIFLTILTGISAMGDLKQVGRIGLKSLIYFEVITTFSLAIGVTIAFIMQPGRVDKHALKMAPIAKYTSAAHTSFNWAEFFLNNFTLQVLIAAVILGIILNYSKKKDFVLLKLNEVQRLVFKALKIVMYLAPIGAFGGMAYTVGKFGLVTLLPLLKLLASVYLTMAIFIFLVLGVVMRYYKLSIWSFLKYIKEELLIVLGTSSSESALPSLMEKLKKTGCSSSTVGLVIPTGYSFNLDGTSIYLSMAVIFLAQLYNVHLSFAEIMTVIGILMITSKGAAGVTGSGFVVLASTLGALHKIPVEGLAFLLGVDKFMSEGRAITNIIGNGVATLVIGKSEGDNIEINS